MEYAISSCPRHSSPTTHLSRITSADAGVLDYRSLGEFKGGEYMGKGKGSQDQADLDNHANQLNPNNDAYWSSRSLDEDE